MKITPRLLRAAMNLWPPFLFSGIHVTAIAKDWRYARVELRSRPWNRNYVGVHFGGNLFSMTDPFMMILLKESLGRDYYVWDRAAEIEYVKPGRGTVAAEFQITDALLHDIRAAAARGEKYEPWLAVDVVDAKGETVARVRKQLYIRLKPEKRPEAP
ncbi:DUF4442 domain-containing protein [Hylemonella sp. W303a]|uniref:DUF4442 domain-containing protein n=1 Tax=Hylemonella sp. W303a TaxID=3389873 RepID=UPI00396AF59D